MRQRYGMGNRAGRKMKNGSINKKLWIQPGPNLPLFGGGQLAQLSWAPGPSCPGPNLPLFRCGQLGPGAQLSGAQFAENRMSPGNFVHFFLNYGEL